MFLLQKSQTFSQCCTVFEYQKWKKECTAAAKSHHRLTKPYQKWLIMSVYTCLYPFIPVYPCSFLQDHTCRSFNNHGIHSQNGQKNYCYRCNNPFALYLCSYINGRASSHIWCKRKTKDDIKITPIGVR